jgi:DNA polymerase-1
MSSPLPTPVEINHCRGFLEADIQARKPAVVLLVGDQPLRSIARKSGITTYHGTPLSLEIPRPDPKRPSTAPPHRTIAVPIFNPGYVLRDPRHETAYRQDLARAKGILRDITQQQDPLGKLRTRYTLIETHDALQATLEHLRQQPLLAFDTEYEPLDQLDPTFRVLGVSFSWAPQTGVFIPVDHPESPFQGDPEVKRALVALLEAKPLIVHNAEVDVFAAVALGADVNKLTVAVETMLLSAAVLGPEVPHKLKALAVQFADTAGYEDELEDYKRRSAQARAVLQKHLKGGKTAPTPAQVNEALAYAQHWGGRLYDDDVGYSTIPLRVLGTPYAAADTDSTFQIAAPLLAQLNDRQQHDWFFTIYQPGWRLNYQLYRRGLLVDWEAWRIRWEYWTGQMHAVYRRALALPEVAEFAAALPAQKKTFSLGSDQQMRKLLFGVFGLTPGEKTTPTGAISLDKEAIKELAQREEHPLVQILAEHAQIEKALSTLEGYAEKMHSTDGRIHARFFSISHSGRRRTKPNVQNITAGAQPGVDDPTNLRRIFTAGPGRLFVASDYGQLEFRLAACAANDPVMIQCCRDTDPHQLVATKLEMPRREAKTVNFSILYGISPEALRSRVYAALNVQWSEDKAESVVNDMKQLYRQLFLHISRVHAHILEHRWVTSVLGNRRDFPHINSNDPSVRDRALREGWNHCIQSLGHDLLELVMQHVRQGIHDEGLDWHIENDTHDEFLLSVPEADAPLAAQRIRYVMETVPVRVLGDWLQVPLPAEVKIGPNFGALVEQKECQPMPWRLI